MGALEIIRISNIFMLLFREKKLFLKYFKNFLEISGNESVLKPSTFVLAL